MKLSELATDRHRLDADAGLVLTEEEVLQCYIAAARRYAAYGLIRSLRRASPTHPAISYADASPEMLGIEMLDVEPAESWISPAAPDAISQDTVLTLGESAIVAPLALLYCERMNALRLESTRIFGVDPYGRSSVDVAAEISAYEANMIPMSFSGGITSVY
jgi:hypothetical protein